MVKEKRIVFEIKDLRRIGLRCGKCGGEIGASLKTFDEVPRRCPVCKHDWRTMLQSEHIIDKIVEAMNFYRQNPSEDVGFFMELNGDDPSEN